MIKRIYLITFILLFCLTLSSCKTTEKFYGIHIEEVCIEKENPVFIENNSIIYADGISIRIHYKTSWKYIIQHVKNNTDIPIIESLFPIAYTYYKFILIIYI